MVFSSKSEVEDILLFIYRLLSGMRFVL